MSLTPAEWYRLAEIASERSGAPAGFMPSATKRLVDSGFVQVTGRVVQDDRVVFHGTAQVTEAGKIKLQEKR